MSLEDVRKATYDLNLSMKELFFYGQSLEDKEHSQFELIYRRLDARIMQLIYEYTKLIFGGDNVNER